MKNGTRLCEHLTDIPKGRNWNKHCKHLGFRNCIKYSVRLKTTTDGYRICCNECKKPHVVK